MRIVGEAGLRQAAVEEGLCLVEDGDPDVDWVMAGLDRAFTYEKLTSATRAIMAGARFVATNADALLPVEGGVFPWRRHAVPPPLRRESLALASDACVCGAFVSLMG